MPNFNKIKQFITISEKPKNKEIRAAGRPE